MKEMNKFKIEEVSEKIGVRVDFDGFSTHFLTMMNGHNWAGVQITPEIAKMGIRVLEKYLERK